MLQYLEIMYVESYDNFYSEVYDVFTEMAMIRANCLLNKHEKAKTFCDMSVEKGIEKMGAKDLQELPGMPADFAFTMLNLFSGTYPWFVKYAPNKGTTTMIRLFKNYFLMLKGVKLAAFLVKLLTSIQYDCQNIERIRSIGMCLVTKFSKGKYQRNFELRLYVMYGLMFMGYAYKRNELTTKKNEMVEEVFFLAEVQWPNELFLLVFFVKIMSGSLLDKCSETPTIQFTASSCPLHRFDVALETNNFERQIRPTAALKYFHQHFYTFKNLLLH